MDKIKILIADDHSFIREGIKTMLEDAGDLEIIGEAENGREAIEKIKELSPDVVILDIAMPVMSGIEAARIIKKKFKSVNILALTIHNNDEYISRILRAGAIGYMLKNTEKNEFINAIRRVSKGKKYFSEEVSNIIFTGYLRKEQNQTSEKDQKRGKDTGNPLTKREREIVGNIAKGLSNKKIADKLFVSVRTVETHRKNIMRKLKVNNTALLVQYATRKGILLAD